MLNRIVHFSLRFRGIVIALGLALAGYGIYSYLQAKYDVFPEFAPPVVNIQTESPGLAPEQVEQLVTVPIENAVNGVPGIEALRSQSIQGFSLIVVTFRAGTDVYRARQQITERLTPVAGGLPSGVKPPIMTPLTSSTSTALIIGLTSKKRTLMDLRTLADWTIKRRLLSVPGVAKVAVFGGEVKEFQVQVNPERLVAYGLSMDDVLTAAGRATAVTGAGFIENDNQRIVLQSKGQSLTAEELAQSVVSQSHGAIVRLGDLGRVVAAPEPPIGAASIMGETGVDLIVSSQFGANTLEVTRNVEQALKELRPSLAARDVTLHPNLFRPANFIETATHNVKKSLLIGALLVVIVLTLFLFELRTAAISCAAIPLSLLGAVIVLQQFGITLNTMTLGGLAIAVGVVVDDAVIDVENILRRLRENRHLPRPRSDFQVVFDASLEVRGAVVYATFAVILVFFPILTMSGVQGRLFAPLGQAFIYATLVSLLIALTLTPALGLVFLGRREFKRDEPPVVHWLKVRYMRLLEHVERNARAVLWTAGIVTALGLAALPFLGGGFLPELNEGHFIVHMSAVPGTSLNESLVLVRKVTQGLLKLPFVRSVSADIGRAELADDTWGSHYTEMNVDLMPLSGEEAEQAQFQIRRALAQFPGVNFAVKTFLTERMEEVLSGQTASVVINIFGPDLDMLDTTGRQIARLLNTIPGAADVQVQSPPGMPQLVIELKPAALARWGFDAASVLNDIRTAYQGAKVAQVYEGNKVFDVKVILDAASRRSISQVAALPVKSPSGAEIPLGQLAHVYESSGRYLVLHQGAQRVQTVTCNAAGREASHLVAEAQRRIEAEIKLPSATYLQFTGTAAGQAAARRDLLMHSALAGLGIVLLLSVVMRDWRNLFLVLLNLPFALVGGVLAVFGSGGMLSLGALVGFVTLFGITLRNSILMISHYEHLVTVEGETWGPRAALRGASERLAPILMTALVTALGLLPLAVGSGAPGHEIEGPMAIVILGGLFTSTALNLLVLPTLALRFRRFEKAAIDHTGKILD